MSGIFAALIFVSTNFLRINIPLAAGGYIHPGDTFIYLAACFLPLPYAAAASSIGAAFSDSIAAPIYIPATLIIKALLTLFFTNKNEKFLTKRNVVGCVLAGVTGLAGYFVYESFIYSPIVAAANVPMGAIQPLVSAILFVFIALALDKMNFKKRFQL
jgi:uncharacterized repeat protein (TIGR04002 family)